MFFTLAVSLCLYLGLWQSFGKSEFKEGRTAAQQQLKERSEKCERHSPEGTKVSVGGGPEVFRQREAPCISEEAHGGAGCPPAVHGHHTMQP